MNTVPKAIYRFNVIPIKLPMALPITKLEQKILEFVWKLKRPCSQRNLEKEKQSWESTFLTSDYTTKL